MRPVGLIGLIVVGCAFAAWPQGENLLDDLTHRMDFEARRASSSNEDLARNGDAKHLDPLGTLVLLDADGPGQIAHFWNTLGSFDPFAGRALVLRIYYDGAEKPSVEAPLGDFFAMGHAAQKDLTSFPVTATSYGRSRTCWWRMPFRKHIKVTLTNDSPTIGLDSFYYYIDWRKLDSLPDDTPYFHAHYRQEFPAKPGNYTLLDTHGRGHYVGTVYSVHQMESGWFGEGDDFFYIDGAAYPQLRGTGTEDYFNDAWGFREFCNPFNGVPLYEGVLAGDRVTAYRWHIQDPIPFKESLKVTIEHRGSIFNEQGGLTEMEMGSFEERADWVSSVAFWYQYPPAAFDEALPPVAQRTPPYRMLMGPELAWRADPPLLVVPAKPYLMYAPNMNKASIEFDFDADKDGRYRIDAILLHSLMSGIYQPLLDGKKIGGPLDLCIGNYDPMWHFLDLHDLKAGKHTLRFEGTGEDSPKARSVGPHLSLFGIAGISLLRLEDMPGYRQTLQQLLEKNSKKK
jgi:hypothetical protein